MGRVYRIFRIIFIFMLGKDIAWAMIAINALLVAFIVHILGG